VTARRRNLERPARDLLAADVGQVGSRRRQESRRRCRLGPRRRSLQGLDELAEMSNRDDGTTTHHRGFGGVLPGHEQTGDGALSGIGGHGQHAAHGTHAPVEGQFAHEHRSLVHLWRDGARGGQDADGDGNVEGGPVLAQVGWRQIHGDATERVLESAVLDGAANADAAFLHAGIRQAHDVAAGQPVRHVHFDVDGGGLDAENGCGKYVSKHMAD
jgi:hypothetical protein